MKVTGSASLHAPIDRVWDALQDPAILVRTIPGCQQLAAVGADEYRMTVTAGVASIKGTYLGTVRLTDQQPPSSFVLLAAGSGAPGTVQADVTVTLSQDGAGTRLTYDADAVVGGPVGGVGQRMLAGVARRTAGEFFRAVDDVLAGVESAVETAPPGATEPVVSPDGRPAAPPTGIPDQPAVFTRPAPPAGAGPGNRPLLLAALAGAAIALAGVAVGARVARRT